MSFKRKYQTFEAIRILSVDRRTLWKWGEQGKVNMRREGEKRARFFDADQIDKLAKKIPKKHFKGVSFFPEE